MASEATHFEPIATLPLLLIYFLRNYIWTKVLSDQQFFTEVKRSQSWFLAEAPAGCCVVLKRLGGEFTELTRPEAAIRDNLRGLGYGMEARACPC
jgi:hypothetical protein